MTITTMDLKMVLRVFPCFGRSRNPLSEYTDERAQSTAQTIAHLQATTTKAELGMDIADYNWTFYKFTQDATKVDQRITAINWHNLRAYASKLHQGEACKVEAPIGMGGSHFVRILTFQGGDRWLARFCVNSSPELDYDSTLLQDAGCLQMIAERTTVPVPKVFAVVPQIPKFGASFVLMECLPGNVGIDFDPYDLNVPQQYKSAFFKDMANAHVQISSLVFPRIGTPVRLDDGTITIEEIPGIGGPFDTATEFFRAWAAAAEWPLPEHRTRACSGAFADEVWDSICSFPARVGQLANLIAGPDDSGPFPLVHFDFGHSNIIVDEQYKMLGVIDFDGAFAAPWSMVQFPLTCRTLPIPMDAPQCYDSHGMPVDEGSITQQNDAQGYLQAVVIAERELGMPPKLSGALSNVKVRDVAAAMHYFAVEGKAGFYTRVLDQLEDKPWNPHTQAASSSN